MMNPAPFDFDMKEGLYFEAKSASKGVPDDFWETYSSFANTFGGTVVFGVSEVDGHLEVTGVTDPESIIKTLWDNLNNPRFTNVNILKDKDVEVREIDEKQVIVIRIPQADRRIRPVYVKNNMNSGTFKRNHEGDYHCRMDEIKEMIRDSEDITVDITPIENLNMECFDTNSISGYLNELRVYKPNHPWIQIPMEEFLQLSGAARDIGGSLRPTGSGLLMFGKVSCIRQVYGSYFLDYTEGGGEDRYTYRIHSNSGDWSGNVYTFVHEVLNRLSMVMGVPFELKGFSNRGYSESFIAVREAVMNAVLHADYYLSGGVIIRLGSGRIEIRNPGSMRVRLEDAIHGGVSDPRNNGLMSLAMAVGWVERLGSGIFSIERIRKEGGISSLSIVEATDPSSVKVTIGLGPSLAGKNEHMREKAILDILSEYPNITRDDLADKLGISVRTLSAELKKLRENGKLERIGGNKNGFWRVIRS